jgi:hypothetical protein
MLEINKNLFERWENLGVRYCHWKSIEHLDDGLLGITDMDVLVDINDKEKCSQELEKIHFLRVKPQKGSFYANVDDWIGFDNSTGKLVHLHLHYKIVTGKKHVKEYVLPWDEFVLSTRIKDVKNNVYIIDPNIEIFILFTRLVLKSSVKTYVRALLGKYSIPKDYKVEIDYLKQRVTEIQQKNAVEKLFNQNSKILLGIINKPMMDAKDFLDINRIVRKNLKNDRNSKTIKALYKSMYNKNLIRLRHLFRVKANQLYILKKSLPENGVSIAFLGSDGSGKSTISKDIIDWLSWKLECQNFYLGSGDHYRTPYSLLVKWIQTKAKRMKTINNNHSSHSSNRDVKAKKEGEKSSLLKRAYDIFNMFYFLNIAKKCNNSLTKAKNYTAQGGIAIYDRFPQNQFEGINDGPKISAKYSHHSNLKLFKVLRLIEEKNINEAIEKEPDLIIKLIISPEVSIQRKPDHDYEEVARKAEIINSLRFGKSHVLEIDATQEYEKELLEVKSIIWNHLINRS